MFLSLNNVVNIYKHIEKWYSGAKFKIGSCFEYVGGIRPYGRLDFDFLRICDREKCHRDNISPSNGSPFFLYPLDNPLTPDSETYYGTALKTR